MRDDEQVAAIVRRMSDIELAKFRAIGGRLPRDLEARAIAYERDHSTASEAIAWVHPDEAPEREPRRPAQQEAA